MQNYFLAYSSFFNKYNLTKQSFKLACLLAKSANHNENYTSYKSKRTMAAECNCSVATITRSIRELKQKNIIEVTNWFGSHDKTIKAKTKRQTTNVYRLTVNPKAENDTTIQCASCAVEELKPNELKVYAFISMRVGKRTTFNLSRAEIAQACKISKSLVSLIIKILRDKGFIDYNPTIVYCGKGYNCFKIICDKISNTKTEMDCYKNAITFAKTAVTSNEITTVLNLYTNMLSCAGDEERNNISLLVDFLNLFIKSKKDKLLHTPWYYSRKLKISWQYLQAIIENLPIYKMTWG